jgi:AbrB family looped-hinge helix DNA binding protein
MKTRDTLPGAPHSGALGARMVGETTITGKNQISLPADGVRALGWKRGDQLLVELIHDDMLVLMRRPERWVDAFAGKLGHLYGSHDDTIEHLVAERESWDRPEHG